MSTGATGTTGSSDDIKRTSHEKKTDHAVGEKGSRQPDAYTDTIMIISVLARRVKRTTSGTSKKNPQKGRKNFHIMGKRGRVGRGGNGGYTEVDTIE